MKRWLPAMALLVVVGVALVLGRGGGGGNTPAARINHIESEVRCPQCEGQSVLASDAPAARAVRGLIVKEVDAGATNGEIERALQDTYGTDILLRPPASGVAGLVWVLPVVALVAAAGGLALAFARWRWVASQPVPSEEDRALVAAALDGETDAGAGEGVR